MHFRLGANIRWSLNKKDSRVWLVYSNTTDATNTHKSNPENDKMLIVADNGGVD